MKWFRLSLSVIFAAISCDFYSQDVSQLIPQIKEAVVTVYAQNEDGNVFASGSGFIISQNGIGVTNFHVLQGASRGKIKCTNGEEYAISKIIDYSPQYDLIKFKIQSDNSKVFAYLKQQASIPQQGSLVVNYSNPLGSFENTVSTGVVAAIREYKGYEKVIQITAPISHGSSGSPVMNSKGEVIGIATFGIESGQSLNFAVSIQQLQKMTRNLQIPVADMLENEFETPNLKKANMLASIGRFNEAEQIYNQEIARNPNNHLAYYYRGLWACRNNKYNPGIYDLLQASQMDTTNYSYADKAAEYMKNLVIEGYDAGMSVPSDFYLMAADSYQRCIQIDPNRPEAYAGLGYLMLYIGMINRAEEAYRIGVHQLDIAISIYPTVTYHMYRAQLYSQLQSWGKCILDCNQAIVLDPECFRAYLMRGTIRSSKLRQVNDGIVDLTIAIDLAETNEEKSNAYAEMATAYYCKHLYGIDRSPYVLNTALDYANKAYKLYPNPVNQSIINDINRARGYR